MSNTAIGITIAILTLALLGIMLWLAFTAPTGWQDERGFHYGEPGDE